MNNKLVMTILIVIILVDNAVSKGIRIMTLAAPANLEIVDQPQRAGVLMIPMRRDILATLVVPDSATGLARKMGLARQVPMLPETKENLLGFCTQHFFGERARMETPVVTVVRDGGKIRVEARFSDGPNPAISELWWSFDRSPAGSLPYEHDAWQSATMGYNKDTSWVGRILVPEGVKTVDFLTVHHDETGGMPGHISGPSLRVVVEP